MALKDKVTIGIPAYNESQYICKTIESAISQNARVSVADNASTDGTTEICRDYAEEKLIDYVRHGKNIGGWNNFKYLALQATTPYFIFLGGHDLFEAFYVEKLWTTMEQNPECVLCASNRYCLVDSNGNVYKEKEFSNPELLQSDNELNRICNLFESDTYCAVFYGLYKTKILQECFNEQRYFGIGLDQIFIADLLLKGKVYCSDTIDAGSIMQKYRRGETWPEMIKRQASSEGACKDAVFEPSQAMMAYIQEAESVIDKAKSNFFLRYWKKRKVILYLKKSYLWKLLVPEINLFVIDRNINFNEIIRLKIKYEKRFETRLSKYKFFDKATILCLGESIIKYSQNIISSKEYTAIKNGFIQRGLKIPFFRSLKWRIKYVLYPKLREILGGKDREES